MSIHLRVRLRRICGGPSSALAAASIALLTGSCITVVPGPIIVKEVSNDTAEVVERHPGVATFQDVTTGPRTLTARVTEQVSCAKVLRQTISHQRFQTYDRNGLTGALILGSLLTAGGAGCTGIGFAANSGAVAGTGVLSMITGVVEFIYIGVVAGQGVDKPLPPDPWSETNDTPIGSYPCGGAGASGSVKLLLHGEPVETLPLQLGGKVVVDLGKNNPELRGKICGDEAHLSEPLVIAYEPLPWRGEAREEEQAETPAMLRMDISDCVRAESAAQILSGLEGAPGDRSGTEALDALQHAAALVNALPRSDPDAPALTARLESVRAQAAEAIRARIDADRKLFQEALQEHRLSEAVRIGTGVLQSSRGVSQNPQRDWAEIVGDLVAAAAHRGLEGATATALFLSRDPPTRSCIESATKCPPGVTRPLVVQTLTPMTNAISSELDRAIHELHAATDAMDQSSTESNAAALQAALERAHRYAAFCETPTWDSSLDSSCSSLRDGTSAANRAKSVGAEKIQRDKLNRASAAWKEFLNLCRTATSAADKVHLATRSTKLPPPSDLDGPTRTELRRLCQSAGCPSGVCP
jgi:hypothetical protein